MFPSVAQGSFLQPVTCETMMSLYSLNCLNFTAGPNHGGLHSGAISQFELYYVIVVQQDGLKVKAIFCCVYLNH